MANTLSEARELIEAARSADRLHAVIQNRRFLPGMLTVSANLRRDIRPGDVVGLSIEAERVHLFDPATEARL